MKWGGKLRVDLGLERVFLDEVAAGFDDVAHELGEELVGGVGGGGPRSS